ncbi:hypothetical protein QCA50_000219 [Cerrena zonata]|uniref:Uncharacterized protein n=1 Tax=Cerrena zonata TaxID=2478898 RepID=A0AAW0GXI8_9APHY
MHAYAREREVEMALDIEEQEAEYDVYLYWYSDSSVDRVVEDDQVINRREARLSQEDLSALAQSDEESAFESVGYSRCFRSGFFIERLSDRFDSLIHRLKAILASAGPRASRSSSRD